MKRVTPAATQSARINSVFVVKSRTMSLERYPDNRLDDIPDQTHFPEIVDDLCRLYDSHNGLSLLDLDEIGISVPGFLEVRPRVSSQDQNSGEEYNWFAVFVFNVDGSEVRAAIPWRNDSDRAGDVALGRSITFFAPEGIDNEKVEGLAQELFDSLNAYTKKQFLPPDMVN